MTPSARIWWDQSIQAYRLSSPFNKAFVDTLKTTIPAGDRSYEPTTKIWTFAEKHLSGIQTLLKTIGASVTVVTRQQAEAATAGAGQSQQKASANSLDSVMVQFVKLLPFEAAQSAYRKAAVLLHPDHGGNMDKMSQLNSAWTRLEKELYNG